MKRTLLVGFGALLIAAAVVSYFVLARLDALVASAIESHGSAVAGVPVRVASVHIELREARGTIRGLRVGNPEGFSGGDALSLGEITLALDRGSLGATPIVVDQLRVAAPQARFEVDAGGRSNFEVIQGNVDRYAAPTPAAQEGGAGRRIALRRLELEEGSIEADVSAVSDREEPYRAELSGLHLQDVGGAQGGTPGEIGKALLGAFTKTVMRSVAANEAGRAVEERIGGPAGKEAGKILRKLLD